MNRVFLASLAVLMSLTSCKKEAKTEDKTVEQTPIVQEKPVEEKIDWSGTYTGTIPCDDCPGTEMVISLKNDNTYELYRITKDSKNDDGVDEYGSFSWSNDKRFIILDNADKTKVKVKDGKLVVLDVDGNDYTGDNASSYVLVKAEGDFSMESLLNDKDLEKLKSDTGFTPKYEYEYVNTTDKKRFVITYMTGEELQAAISNGNEKITLPQVSSWARGAVYANEKYRLVTQNGSNRLYIDGKRVPLVNKM